MSSQTDGDFPMPRTLVIGFGNLDRADDGAAYHVINALRKRLKQDALPEEETGLDDLVAQVDSTFLMQLAPELIDIAASYDEIIFVDAHVDDNLADLHCGPVNPRHAPSTFTHHITPGMLLALLKAIHRKEPTGHLVSLRGYDFDFHRGLSENTESLIDPAVAAIMKLIDLH